MANVALRLKLYLQAQPATAGVADVDIGDPANIGTWRVHPSSLQPAADAVFAAFDPNDDTREHAEAQRATQALIDAMPIFEKAIILALIDQLNVIRSKLSPALPAITPQQALDAVRTKAGTL